MPPPFKPYDGKPILKRLDIRNRGGWITLHLELRHEPTTPMTVWGARPCNRGVERPAICSRLGWLPAPRDGTIDITEQYFQEHGEYIRNHGVRLARKRIFIRIRREVDGEAVLFEEVNAVVP